MHKKRKKKGKKHSDTENWINSAWGYFKALGNLVTCHTVTVSLSTSPADRLST